MIAKNRYLSILILSGILILILTNIGDFDNIVKQIKNQEDYIELGSMHSCDPGQAICSIAQVVDGKAIKFSLGFSHKVKSRETFSIKLKVNGIDKQNIRRAEISFKPLEEDSQTIVERFKFLSSEGSDISYWNTDSNITTGKNKNINWTAMVKVSTLEETYTGSFSFTIGI